MNFATTDLVILIGYLLLMMGFGIWIANREKNENAKDYFLASSALPWWAVGGSLIASNISTEQILGMNGSGYVMGLAIGAYELMAALTLILVAKFLLPVFIKKEIYTMPQFLEVRFDGRVRTLMAFFWVALIVLVNISSIFYLGAIAIQTIGGYDNIIINNLDQVRPFVNGELTSTLIDAQTFKSMLLPSADIAEIYSEKWISNDYKIPLYLPILILAVYSATLSIFGGLKAVVWTDVIQVVILIIGGLTAAYMVLSFVGDGSFFGGLNHLYEKAPGHFNMILEEGNPGYDKLPGISVLIGGMWIANIYYWGNNQYIIQRALASKSLAEAQKGVAFAALMKLFIPLFAVIPGIAAYVILKDPAAYGFTGDGISVPDQSFPWVLNNFVQVGFKGLVLAALIAAIGSSISSMVNSASTIFTLDIYKNLFVKSEGEGHYVRIGRLAATAALILGALIAPALGSFDQIFQFIQDYTGFVSPGVVAVFLFGMFWRRTTANAAFIAVLISIPLSAAMHNFFPDVPFLVRMALSFVIISGLIVIVSYFENPAGGKKDYNDLPFKLGLMGAILLISVPAGIRILVGDIDTNMTFGVLILGLTAIVFGLLLTENRKDDAKGIPISTKLFKTDMTFNSSAIFICITLAVIYTMLW